MHVHLPYMTHTGVVKAKSCVFCSVTALFGDPQPRSFPFTTTLTWSPLLFLIPSANSLSYLTISLLSFSYIFLICLLITLTP